MQVQSNTKDMTRPEPGIDELLETVEQYRNVEHIKVSTCYSGRYRGKLYRSQKDLHMIVDSARLVSVLYSELNIANVALFILLPPLLSLCSFFPSSGGARAARGGRGPGRHTSD